MAKVDGFWAGAMAVADRVDLPRIAAQVGGWDVLKRDPGAALRRAGVDVAWPERPGFETEGAAIPLDDPGYPSALRDAPRPPAVLLLEGHPGVLQRPCVAIVGSRSCTGPGRAVAHHLGAAFARHGWTVVSGLARGIDAAAHRGALPGGHTAAVLAHGLASTAPASHRGLRRQIVAAGGCMVTAFPDDLQPRPYLFPRRNQWIAGLASAVVVVEAAARSGTMHTVRSALDAGRQVYAVPGTIGAPASAGCLSLLRDGAGVVWDVEEFVSDLTGTHPPDRTWVHDVVAGHPLQQVSARWGRGMLELYAELGRLEAEGVLVRLEGHRYSFGGG